MRPNLSLTNIASTLALLGTSAVVVACGGADKPAVSPTESTTTAAPAGQASCAAHGSCGAGAKTADAPKDGTTTTPAATGAAAGGSTGSATPTPAPTTAAAATPATPPSAKPAAASPKPPPAMGKGTTGQASCGAGTCSADAKKK